MRPRRLPAILRTAGLVCLVPFLAHLPELLGLVHTDPLLFVSDLPLHPDSSLLGGTPFVDGNAGQTTMTLGRLAAEDWLGGRLPWWNPYTGVGLPLAAEMQPAAFFLPFVLLLHFAHGVLYLKIALQVLAGLTMLGFLRALGLLGWAACLGAVLFQLGGTFAWYGDAPYFPIAFLPLLLWGLERTWRLVAQGRRGGEAWLALAIGGSLLAGFPETAFVDGLMGLCWAVLRMASLERPLALVFARRVAAGGLAGLVLAAPAMLPFLGGLPTASLGPHAFSAAAHLEPRYAAALLFPYVFGPINRDFNLAFWIHSGGYLGLLAPLLALCALRRLPAASRATRLFLGAWVVVMLGAMFDVPLLAGLVRLVPGMRLVFLCRYGLPSVEMAVCTLAAMALQDFCGGGGLRKAARVAAVCLAALATAGLLLARQRLLADMAQVGGGRAFALVSIAWGATSAGALVLLLARPATRLARMAIGGLLIVDSAGLCMTATLAGLTDARIAEGPIAFLQSHQGLYRAYATDDTLFANYGAMLELGSIAYEYTPVPFIWSDYVQAHLNPGGMAVGFPGLGQSSWQQALLVTDRYRDFAAIGVRYVVAPRAVNLFSFTGAAGPQRVYQDTRTEIFELPHAAPYAEASDGCRLNVAGRETMHASCPLAARLIRRELFYPGWHALVDGRRAGISLQDGLFQVIDLPAGESDVVWRYYPPNSRTIWVLFACGGLVLVVFGWREGRGLV